MINDLVYFIENNNKRMMDLLHTPEYSIETFAERYGTDRSLPVAILHGPADKKRILFIHRGSKPGISYFKSKEA